jgi:hypothetical protein
MNSRAATEGRPYSIWSFLCYHKPLPHVEGLICEWVDSERG